MSNNTDEMRTSRIYPSLDDISIPQSSQKRKEPIPRALREQVWLHYAGTKFAIKCPVSWCSNKITAFDFHVGHNIPEAAGGTLAIGNLRPICSRCNLSMGSRYTIDEWSKMSAGVVRVKKRFCVIC